MGIFSLPLVEMCRVCCLKKKKKNYITFWMEREQLRSLFWGSYLESLICSQIFCCCSCTSPNLPFCERETAFSFSFLPLKCSWLSFADSDRELFTFSFLELLKILIELLLRDVQWPVHSHKVSPTNY